MKKFFLSSPAKALAIFIFVIAAAAAGFGLSQVATHQNDIFAPGLEYDAVFAKELNTELERVLDGISNGGGYEPKSQDIEYYISVPQNNINTGNRELVFDSDEMYGIEITVRGDKRIRNSNINVYFRTDDGMPDCKIVMVYKSGYVQNYNSRLEEVQKQAYHGIYFSAGAVVIMMLAFLYLAFVCGRRGEDNKIHLLLQDRIPPELQFIIGSCALLAITAGICVLADACYGQIELTEFMRLNLQIVCALGAAIGAVVVLAVFLSWLRMAKNRSFIKSCLCTAIILLLIKIIKGIIKIVKRIFSKIHMLLRNFLNRIHSFEESMLAHKAVKYSFAAACAFVGIIYMLGVFAGFKTFVTAGILTAFVLSHIGRIIRSHERITDGIKAMRDGNIDYRIELPENSNAYFHSLAEMVNGIGDGMRTATERRVRAERMKTELITNVSHDLKTPLTSIISYSDLLCELHLSPAEANDYAHIIRKKGERLKNLTQDLFDISKAQSGNEQLNIEKIDISLLISQALGESDSVIEKAGLSSVVKLEKELYIMADGKKMSRVIENLIGNIEKYAQKGTRVFVSAKRSKDTIFAEFKNTSATPLDFDTSEICERFARGDSSRSEEGSGLGLAIAKSYTQLCGGGFKIETDGDLFKAQMTFPVCEE